jgi:hypothetical protein
MGFALSDSIVEGNLFNRRAGGQSGKWKYTIALDMHNFYNLMAVEAVRGAWDARKFDGVIPDVQRVPVELDGYWLVVLEPFCLNPFPVMIAV